MARVAADLDIGVIDPRSTSSSTPGTFQRVSPVPVSPRCGCTRLDQLEIVDAGHSLGRSPRAVRCGPSSVSKSPSTCSARWFGEAILQIDPRQRRRQLRRI